MEQANLNEPSDFLSIIQKNQINEAKETYKFLFKNGGSYSLLDFVKLVKKSFVLNEKSIEIEKIEYKEDEFFRLSFDVSGSPKRTYFAKEKDMVIALIYFLQIQKDIAEEELEELLSYQEDYIELLNHFVITQDTEDLIRSPLLLLAQILIQDALTELSKN